MNDEILNTGSPVDACWRRIGVYGDRTCPLLPGNVHCHNCATQLDAVRRLGELPAPPFYDFARRRGEWAAHYATAREASGGERDADAAAMVFRLGNEWLALPVEFAQEFVEPRPLCSLPHRRGDLVRGLVNLRGELVICISLFKLLGVEPATLQSADKQDARRILLPRMMVIGTHDRRVASVVDEVHGIHRFSSRDRIELPTTVAHAKHSFTVGTWAWNHILIGALDGAALMRAIDAGVA